MPTENVLVANVKLLRKAREEKGISVYWVKRYLTGRVSHGACYKYLTGALPPNPRWRILEELADALDVTLLEEVPVVCPVSGDWTIPVAVETVARTDQAMVCELTALEAEMLCSEGLVAVRIRDRAAWPIAGRGQYLICDPQVHPDKAKPHPQFLEPVAFVRLHSGECVVGRWRRRVVGKSQRIVLTALNDQDIDPETGVTRQIELRERQIAEAWTVRGARYW